MAEYKPKLKDVVMAVEVNKRDIGYINKEVTFIKESMISIQNAVKDLYEERFTAKDETYYACNDPIVNVKLDKSIHIELATFAKNKCPHCGSHNLHYTFNPDAFSDSTVNCRDCHNSWKVGGCAEDIDSPYAVANVLRTEHRTLFEENKRLQEENEKLKKQAAVDASYMVTVEDLMSRLKSCEERIEALKQENNKLLINNAVLESDNENLEKKVKELKNELEKARDHIKTQKSNIALLEDKNKKLENGLEIAKRKLELQLLSNTPLQFDPDSVVKIDVLKDEKRNLQKEKEELKKALNIYQNITDLDVTLTRNTAYVRLIDSDDAGRAMVKGDELDALCDAYLKYHDAFRKEK